MLVKYTILDPTSPDITRFGQIEVPDDGSDPLSDVTNYDVLKTLWEKNFPGIMEHVTVWDEGQYTDMFVDDCGAIKNLPINEIATRIYHANLLQHNPGADTRDWPRIHGPTILFHSKVWH